QSVRAEAPQLDLAGGLDGVGVQQRTGGMGDLGERADVVDGADLVVRQGEGDQRRVLTQCGAQRVGAHGAVGSQLDEVHVEAVDAVEVVDALEHRLVLGGGGDQVLPAWGGEGEPLEGQVRRFGAPGGEDDVAAARPEHGGGAGAGVLEPGRGDLAHRVVAGRVAEGAGEVGPGGLERLPAHGGGGGAVQVEHRRVLRR